MNYEPWKIDGQFDADVSVDIVSNAGFSFCEIIPLFSEWSKEEIARAAAIRAVPEMLDALKAIRKIGYDTPVELHRLREAMLKIIDMAEFAIGAAEPSTARNRKKVQK